MNCPVCSAKTQVINTRDIQKRKNQKKDPVVRSALRHGFDTGIVRVRRCPECSAEAYTYELTFNVTINTDTQT